MELATLISVVRERWLTALVAGVAVAGLVGGLPSILFPPTSHYEASAEVAFNGALVELDQYPIDGEVQAYRMASSFAAMAMSNTVLGNVAATMSLDAPLDEIKDAVESVTVSSGIVRVTVKDPDEKQARAMLSEIMKATTELTSSTIPRASDGEPLVEVLPMGGATVIVRADPNGLGKTAVLALFAGLIAAAGAAWLRHAWSSRVTLEDDVRFAVAQRQRDFDGNASASRPQIATIRAPRDLEALARVVRDGLESGQGSTRRTLVFASGQRAEFAAALASSFVDAGRWALVLNMTGDAPVLEVTPSDVELGKSTPAAPAQVESAMFEHEGMAVADYIASAAFDRALAESESTVDRLVFRGGGLDGAGALHLLATKSDSIVLICETGEDRGALAEALSVIPDHGRGLVVFVG